MRAMLSEREGRPSRSEYLPCEPQSCESMSASEARRILAETQACRCAGGWHWTPERGYWQCEDVADPSVLTADVAAALAESLAAFVGDAQ